jgi:hypothetical protein
VEFKSVRRLRMPRRKEDGSILKSPELTPNHRSCLSPATWDMMLVVAQEFPELTWVRQPASIVIPNWRLLEGCGKVRSKFRNGRSGLIVLASST